MQGYTRHYIKYHIDFWSAQQSAHYGYIVTLQCDGSQFRLSVPLQEWRNTADCPGWAVTK